MSTEKAQKTSIEGLFKIKNRVVQFLLYKNTQKNASDMEAAHRTGWLTPVSEKNNNV